MQGTFTDFWSRLSGGLQNIAPDIFGYPKGPTSGVEETTLPPISGTGPTPASTGGAGSRFDIGRQAYRFFIDRGLTPDQAEAWAGNFAWESGGRTDAVRENDNPAGSPDAPHSAGIAQWNGPRLRGLLDYARRQGIDIPAGNLSDPNYVRQSIARVPMQTQLEYAWQESQTTEGRAFTGITSQQPALGAISFFRPRGWSAENPAGGEAFENRRALGRRVRELEDRQVMVDRSADAGMAPDPALERVPAPMGSTGGPMTAAPAAPAAAPTGVPSVLPMTPGGRADPYAGLNIQRSANPQGSITGFIDRLMGVPTAQDRAATLEATTSEEARRSVAGIVRRAGQLAAQNPGMQPQQLYSAMISDPEIARFLPRVPPNQAVSVLQSIAQTAGRPPFQPMAGGPGTQPQAFDPAAGTARPAGPTVPPADVQEVEYEMRLFRENPEEFARYMAAKRARTGSQNVRPTAEVVTGGTDRARALGLNLRPGERAEVKFERDPISGMDRMVDVNFPDRPPIDLGQLAAQETTRRLVQSRSQIEERQAAVMAAARTAERIHEQLEVTGETAQGVLGVVTRVAEGVTAQAVDAARIAGVPLDPTRYSEFLRPFVRAGANSAATQSNIVALAFMLARAQNPSGQITQRDLENALTQLGSGMTGSTSQMRASLQEMMRNAIGGVDDLIAVRGPSFAGTEVAPPRLTADLLREAGLNRYTQPREPLTGPRSFGRGEIERLNMQQIIEMGRNAQSLSAADRERVFRRYQALKSIEQETPLESPAR